MVGSAVGRAISTAFLRDVLRSKLRSGITKDAVNLLISRYVPPEARTDRVERGTSRQPLAQISQEWRVDFLNALLEIPKPLPLPSRPPATTGAHRRFW
jgi:hypothetical protein